MRPALAAFAAAAFAVTAPACSGGGDKAGGKAENTKPLALTLATYDERDPVEFADAVGRLSAGSIRINVALIPYGDPDYERHTVEDVRRGDVELGLVGARFWDTMGVSSFDALLAPFLVDSLALEQRVLESRVAARMLEGVGRAGVVGVALLPGEVRIPWGISRPLVRRRDFRGARIGIRPGKVARATFRALGATAKRLAPGDPSGLDGAEFEPWAIAFSSDPHRSGTVATNVALWPRAQTIVMNRAAFERLTPSQRQILRRAARDALQPALERVRREEERLPELACERRSLSSVAAVPADLRALHKAVRPVYEQLERDARTKRFIAAIRRLRRPGSAAPEPVSCSGVDVATRIQAARRLQGRWRMTLTRDDLLSVGLGRDLPSDWNATVVYEFADGRFEGNSDPQETGTYAIDGDILYLVFETGKIVNLGEVYALRWSVYRDTLVLSDVSFSEHLQAVTVNPWRRVR